MNEDTKKSVFLERVWAIALKDLGINAENVLRRANLPRDLLTRESPRVSLEDYFRLWSALEDEAADPELPIKLVQLDSAKVFHPPVFAALCSPNLKTAVRRLAEYKKLCAPTTVKVEDDQTGFFVGFEWDDPMVRAPSSYAALELAFMTQIARIGTREWVRPCRVESPYKLAPSSVYEEFFGCGIVDSKRHGVTFEPADAERPFLTANESIWETFKPELRRRLTQLQAESPISEQVRTLLLEGLPSGRSSIDDTARRLGVSSRTLQRNLRAEGVSYKEVVGQTREQLARHYVTDTKLSYAEISFLIGYEEPSSFFRAFRDWTGNTPEAVRLAAV